MTINQVEPGDIETLYFNPSIVDSDRILSQTVAIAPLKNRETSIIFSVLVTGGSSFVHLVFTEEETDMIIKGLQECKVCWDEGRVI